MTRTVLVAGTASHVGKSTVAAGLCRLLADREVGVAPYKAQNMSNNARAVATPDGDFGEIGVSQYVQARAARILPTTDVNPVLLKPRGDGESQLVVHGEAVGHVGAGEYYEGHWERAREAAVASHERLAADHDVVVAEGAGSIAEINLHDRDLANVETGRFADAEILLVADVERGGVFAALVGTLELMPADLRERVAGAIVNRFRGDRTLLEPGIEAFEARTGVPVLGVLPHDDPGLPEEDSVALPPEGERAVWGRDDGVPEGRCVTIAVPRFPRASNVTDVGPLAREPGVRVAWVPPGGLLDVHREGGRPSRGPDAVVLPGTKNTVDDLLACREAGLGEALRAFDGPIVGLCGGYQMLGEVLTNAAVEGTGDRETVEGFGLLPVETRFAPDKRVEPVTRELRGVGPLSGARGPVSGYEIHVGDTELVGTAERPFPDEGAAAGNVLGTYLHGLFENRVAREAFLEAAFAAAGHDRPEIPGHDRPYTDGHDRPYTDGHDRPYTDGHPEADPGGGVRSPHDRAAALLLEHADLDALGLP